MVAAVSVVAAAQGRVVTRAVCAFGAMVVRLTARANSVAPMVVVGCVVNVVQRPPASTTVNVSLQAPVIQVVQARSAVAMVAVVHAVLVSQEVAATVRAHVLQSRVAHLSAKVSSAVRMVAAGCVAMVAPICRG